ncbi:hypothetical protein VOI54_15170 [Tamlana sp. 2201CG12-4]|uniref:OB-fold protein n=1 Tax=Tamlana sp. 2201CG12-4 TaxID=3112582 RepID=UPI002DBC8DE9|nr:hypothetical protein [Tamlana sp. 2201CG12-4]MEC3908370.1 hypothetical protein [Tamlana sp. 2201CG12-4]
MARNKNKLWLIILITLILLTIVGIMYIYQEHRDIKTESPVFVLTSGVLIQQFSSNTSESEKKYLDKVIEVSGIISHIDGNSLTLNDKLFCLLQNPVPNIIINTSTKVKGRCIGYDDLLQEVKLDQCIIINN